MQSNKYLLFGSIFLIFLCGLNLSSHGLSLKTIKSNDISIINITYPGGKSVSNAKIIIYYQTKILFQQGRTDKNGLFCFKPDSSGIYRILVDDEMGHRKSINLNITDDSVNSTDFVAKSVDGKTDQAQPLHKSKIREEKENKNNIFKILFGITLIILITLILFLLKNKNET